MAGTGRGPPGGGRGAKSFRIATNGTTYGCPSRFRMQIAREATQNAAAEVEETERKSLQNTACSANKEKNQNEAQTKLILINE